MADSAKAQTTYGGIGLGGLTFLALLVLKLGGWANITWFWVFFPLWFGFAVVIGIILIIAIIWGLCLLGAKLLE